MRDFFISYTKLDEEWAEWIAFVLEEKGYSVYLQSWDFAPGRNFILEMQRAASDSKRTIAVISKSYMAGLYTQPEWAAALATDPTGRRRGLIPIRTELCNIEGMLGPIIYIDLVDLDEKRAESALVKGISEGRFKPHERPIFPTHMIKKPFPPQNFDYNYKDERREKQILDGRKLLDSIPDFLKLGSISHSIVFLDVDGQTGINKKFSKDIGNYVLEKFLELIKNTFRNCQVGRCGDDTFFALSNSTLENTMKKAKRLLKNIAEFQWSTAIAEGLFVSGSAGVAQFSVDEIPAETALRAAMGCRHARMYGGNKALPGPKGLKHPMSHLWPRPAIKENPPVIIERIGFDEEYKSISSRVKSVLS